MKKYTLFLATAICLAFLYAYSPFRAVSPQQMQAVNMFLGLSCANPEMEASIISELRKQPKEAEAGFKKVIEEGPPPKALAAARKDYNAFYKRRQAFLEDDSRKISIKKAGETAREWKPEPQAKAEFIKKKLQTFRLRLAYRALEGLAVLDTESARRYLEQMARDDDFPLSRYVDELLK